MWSSIAMNGFANGASWVAIGWLARILTGSDLGVGIAFAIRTVPRLVFGIPFGALSDRYDRRAILQITNVVGAAVGVGTVIASVTGNLSYGVLVGVSAIVGLLDVSETSVSKALVYDLVGSKQALNGMALISSADQLFAMVASFIAGVLLVYLGAGGAFGAMGTAYFFSALLLVGVRHVHRRKPTVEEAPSRENRSVVRFMRSVVTIWRSPGLLLLAGVAISMEIFAFSSEVLYPSFARDVFGLQADAYGAMMGVRSAGSVVGVLILAAISTRFRQGLLLAWACLLFGLGLVVFSVSPSYLFCLFILFTIGLMWSSVDSLLATLLQYTVKDEERGASVGVWNVSRGFGPIGHLEIGAIAGAAGVSIAQVLNGGVVIVIAIILFYAIKGVSWASPAKDVEESTRYE